MRKAISILLSLALTAGILTGCNSVSTSESGSEKLRIVTTIFPEYDWVQMDPARCSPCYRRRNCCQYFPGRTDGIMITLEF